MAAVFEALNAINVNDKTEKKKSGGTELTYLSWTWAWAEVKKRFPDAHYEIVMNNGLPYVYDENTGYMVFTNVTIDGITHMMWLPVMDGANKAMKNEPYEYSTKYSGKKTVEAATMFDINKTIMRCLVKNLAMFGLGLYIYAGEDLPEVEAEEMEEKKKNSKKKPVENKKQEADEGLITEKEKLLILAELKRTGLPESKICEAFGLKKLEDMTMTEYGSCLRKFKVTPDKKED